MKTTKGIDFVINTRGALYQSYRQGWIKAVKNFEKSSINLEQKGQPYFRMHSN